MIFMMLMVNYYILIQPRPQLSISVFIHQDCIDLPTLIFYRPRLHDVDTSPSVVFSKLSALQCCKSLGPDGWSSAALKETAAELSIPLFINHSNLSLT